MDEKDLGRVPYLFRFCLDSVSSRLVSATLSCPVYVRGRSAGSFPEQRLVIEPKSPLVLYPRPASLSDFRETNSAIQVVNAWGLVPGCIALNPPPSKSFPHKQRIKGHWTDAKVLLFLFMVQYWKSHKDAERHHPLKNWYRWSLSHEKRWNLSWWTERWVSIVPHQFRMVTNQVNRLLKSSSF